MGNMYQNQTIIAPVSGRSWAQMYPVAAGTTVVLIDFDSSFFWIKSADTNGFPQQMREFEFKEVTPKPAQGEVTRKEFDALNSKIEQLLEAMKGAGKNEQSNANHAAFPKV